MTVEQVYQSTLAPTKLFARSCKLVIGVPNQNDVEATFNEDNTLGKDVSGLDIEFFIKKTLKPEPNVADIKIYNLSRASQQTLYGASKLTVKLEAGYAGATSVLYLGEVRSGYTTTAKAESITHLESGDGEHKAKVTRLNLCYGARVPVAVAIQSIVKTLGLNPGNSGDVASRLAGKGFVSVNGGALTGRAASRLTDICRSAGLEWSIQNGAIQILNIGEILQNTKAFEISENTGMVESPTIDSEGIVRAKALLIPGLVPGVLVNFKSRSINGGHRVQQVEYKGQTAGNDWYVEFEAKKY